MLRGYAFVYAIECGQLRIFSHQLRIHHRSYTLNCVLTHIFVRTHCCSAHVGVVSANIRGVYIWPSTLAGLQSPTHLQSGHNCLTPPAWSEQRHTSSLLTTTTYNPHHGQPRRGHDGTGTTGPGAGAGTHTSRCHPQETLTEERAAPVLGT